MKFKKFLKTLNEGGNATAINKKTGEKTLAQKIPIKEIGRSKFIKKFIDIFIELNKRFKQKYGEPLWKNTKIIKDGTVFNGSTSIIMNPNISDDEIIPFKPKVGDIDILIPSYHAKKLWSLLDDLEGTMILPDVIYKGSNKLDPNKLGNQINSVFEVKFGDIVTQSQVDFEFANFKDDIPDEFAKFAHSSSLKDIKEGFKGVAHKYLLRALAGARSRRDDVIVVTPKSTYEKYKIKTVKGEPLIPNFLKFSVDKGLSYAYEQQFTPDGKPWMIDGKYVYKEIPTKNRNYETSIISIFKILFNNADSPDLNKMWSFVGLVDLVKKYLSKEEQQKTLDRMVELCFGKNAQRLERDDYRIDMSIKIPIINYMMKKLGLKVNNFEKIVEEYYKSYNNKKMVESFKDFIIF